MKSSEILSRPKKEIKLSDLFPNEIFWDVNLDELDYKKDMDFIIPRVLDWGNFNNSWENLRILYPEIVIQYYCIHSSQIFGNEKIELLGELFRVNPNQFPRYIK